MTLAKDFEAALAAQATFSRPLKPIGLLADGCLVNNPSTYDSRRVSRRSSVDADLENNFFR